MLFELDFMYILVIYKYWILIMLKFFVYVGGLIGWVL